jgi:hypothetical protein
LSRIIINCNKVNPFYCGFIFVMNDSLSTNEIGVEMVGRYLFNFLKVVFVEHKTGWFISLLVTYLIGGIGIWADYSAIRDSVNSAENFLTLPDKPQLWWAVLPLFTWLVASLAHRETMSRVQAANLVFDEPIISSIPLFGETKDLQGNPTKGLIDQPDLVKITVKNEPYDMSNGQDVFEAYCRVVVFNQKTKKIVIEFDYPRWTENPKPGYQGVPSDRYQPEWNKRTLTANAEKNTIDFIIKSPSHDQAFGFKGASQLKYKWIEERLSIPKGQFLVRLQIFGKGLKFPSETWVSLTNGGEGKYLHVSSTQERINIMK